MNALLQVSDLAKRFGGVTALSGIDFSVADGEIVAMIGPNGAGKSTCFNLIDGQLLPDRGQIQFAGRDITRYGPVESARFGIARTFQVAATFGSLTVLENIQTAIIARKGETHDMLRAVHRRHRDEAHSLLNDVGLAALAADQAAHLAYGDGKRLEFAIALAGQPRMLMMDEPTAGMAPVERRELMALVVDIARKDGLSVLFTEHDMDVVFDHAERIVVLERGAILAEGSPAEVRQDAKVRDSYLGSGFGEDDAGR